MANPEHLAILKKGVDAWNQWRMRSHQITPDLSGANLAEYALVGFNFTGTHLHNVNLAGAQLSNSNLSRANLIGANLTEAWLEVVGFSEANLTDADLRRARLMSADFFGTILRGANVAGANLIHANLSKAKLERANLRCADLRYCLIVGADLTCANLTGSRLYGAAKDDWIIKDIECKYVFLDVAGKNRLPQERDFAPGEFEQLYRTLPTIEYVFQNGMTPMDPLIMDRVVKAIRADKSEFDIQIDSISARGLAPSIKFTVQQEEYKEPALQMIVVEYESRLQRLETEKDRLYDLLGRAIDRAGTRLIEVGSGAVVAMDNATINIEQHIHQAVELQKVITEQPADSPTFAKVAKKTALDIIGSALKDVAKGQVKEAAKQIYELGKDLGPVIVNTAAYEFFRSLVGG